MKNEEVHAEPRRRGRRGRRSKNAHAEPRSRGEEEKRVMIDGYVSSCAIIMNLPFRLEVPEALAPIVAQPDRTQFGSAGRKLPGNE